MSRFQTCVLFRVQLHLFLGSLSDQQKRSSIVVSYQFLLSAFVACLLLRSQWKHLFKWFLLDKQYRPRNVNFAWTFTYHQAYTYPEFFTVSLQIIPQACSHGGWREG